MTHTDFCLVGGLICWTALGLLIARRAWSLFAIAQPAQRDHMDPLPWGLKAIWPLVDLLQFHVGRVVPTGWLLRLRLPLLRAGKQFLVTEQELIALQLLAAGFAAATALLLCAAAGAEHGVLWVFASGVSGLAYPLVWLREQRTLRCRAIARSLPACLDLLVLCVQGGLTLTGAMMQAVDKSEDGPLRSEFDLVLRDIRAGAGRTAALQAMAWRIGMPTLNHLVASVVQAEALGASITATMEAIAEQLRNDRFQNAERQALEAPVKMIGPLVICIFPVTFIIIFAPLVLEFLKNGSRF